MIDVTLCQYLLSAAVAVGFLVYAFYPVLLLQLYFRSIYPSMCMLIRCFKNSLSKSRVMVVVFQVLTLDLYLLVRLFAYSSYQNTLTYQISKLKT